MARVMRAAPVKWDWLSLCASPYDEVPEQVGYSSREQQQKELDRYKAMLEKRFPIPVGVNAYFKVKWSDHDFGAYGEVYVYFDTSSLESGAFALFCDHNLPAVWSDDEVLNMPKDFDPSR